MTFMTETDEFVEYTENRYKGCEEQPEPDMSFLEAWEEIIEETGKRGVQDVLNQSLCARHPVSFSRPEEVKIEIYGSFAGKLPVIYVKDTGDFEQLVTNVAHKGIRPDNLSETGATFLSGKTTRFMILSSKPYSNVPAEELGLQEEEWHEWSLLIRRGHECTHYFTKQTYGISNNILHDEVMADFNGMYEAFGFYRAEWFLRFMGIIEGGGNRMIYYTANLKEETRDALRELLKTVSGKLEMWSETKDFRSLSETERVKKMCMAGLMGIAHGELGR